MSFPLSSYSLFNRPRYFFPSSEAFPFFIWKHEELSPSLGGSLPQTCQEHWFPLPKFFGTLLLSGNTNQITYKKLFQDQEFTV